VEVQGIVAKRKADPTILQVMESPLKLVNRGAAGVLEKR
jgi:hypothetical protein